MRLVARYAHDWQYCKLAIENVPKWGPARAYTRINNANYGPSFANQPFMNKILVVDDDARCLHIMAKFLRLEGFWVATAGDGNLAVLLLDKIKVDLVLSDVMMPGLNGLELLEHIGLISPEIPVISCQDFAHLTLKKSSKDEL